MHNKFVVFTEYYYPVSNTTGYYLTEIIKAVSADWQGNVNIFCATDLDGKPELLTAENIKTVRFSGGKMNKNSLFSRLLKFILITLKFSFAALFRISRGDTVFTVTNPAFMLVFMAMLRKIRKFRYVLLVYDIFPETLIAAGLSVPESLKYRLTLKIFNWAYRAVDHFVVIGRDMAEVVAAKSGRRDNMTLIPNWCNPEEIKPQKREENHFIREYDLYSKRVFALGGNMGRTQGLQNLFEGIKLAGRDPGCAYLLMGGGAKAGEINDFIEKNPDLPVFYTGRVPGELQNDMMNAGDVAIISLTANMYGLSVPSKTYFNLAAGKPLLLIADPDSEAALLIKEHGLGWVVPPDEPQMLADTLKAVAALSDSELALISARARETAEKFFTPEIILAQYKKLFCDR